jgi:hypothetical protein
MIEFLPDFEGEPRYFTVTCCHIISCLLVGCLRLGASENDEIRMTE